MNNSDVASFLLGEINPEGKVLSEEDFAIPVYIDLPDIILEGALGNAVLDLGRTCGYSFQLPDIQSEQVVSHAVTWGKQSKLNLSTLCFDECPLTPEPYFFVSDDRHWLDCLPEPSDLVDPSFWDLGMTYRFIRNNVCPPLASKGKGRSILLVFQGCSELSFDPFEVVRRYLSKDHFLVLGFTEASDSENFMSVDLLQGFHWEVSQHLDPASAIEDCTALITTSDLFVPLGLAAGVPVVALHDSAFAGYNVVIDCYRHPEFLDGVLDFKPSRREYEKLLTYLYANFLVDCSSAAQMMKNAKVQAWVNGTGRAEKGFSLLTGTLDHLSDEELFELAKKSVEVGDSDFWKEYLEQIETLISMHGKGWSKCRQKTLRSLFARQATKSHG